MRGQKRAENYNKNTKSLYLYLTYRLKVKGWVNIFYVNGIHKSRELGIFYQLK